MYDAIAIKSLLEEFSLLVQLLSSDEFEISEETEVSESDVKCVNRKISGDFPDLSKSGQLMNIKRPEKTKTRTHASKCTSNETTHRLRRAINKTK